jgi:hypothetical protein
MKNTKLNQATVLSVLALAAAAGGIYYGVKKNYSPVGITASMLLFSVPFFATSVYIGNQAEKEIV